MKEMSRDARLLLDNMDRILNIIESNIRFMKDELSQGKVNESLHDSYLNIKDCFELYVMSRALPSILEDGILDKDNGDMI